MVGNEKWWLLVRQEMRETGLPMRLAEQALFTRLVRHWRGEGRAHRAIVQYMGRHFGLKRDSYYNRLRKARYTEVIP